ncbi:MAG TPA: hypothetical protein VFH06_01710 [Candidatus Saccharimonadales bacterium]|nr:hypothetical protein [Candidatus Saccharimonadales bacterium]
MKPGGTNKTILQKNFFSTELLLPLILLSLASYGVVQLTPLLTHNTGATQPATWQLVIVGVGIILFSSLFLTYAAKLIGLTRGWLILGVLFSSCMIITKFILIPEALYSQVFTLKPGGFDPNSTGGYFTIAIVLFIVYAAILMSTYSYHRKRVAAVLENKELMMEEPKSMAMVTILILLGLIAVLASGAGAILLFPLFFLGGPVDYVNYALAGGGIVLVLMTVMTIVLSLKYLQHASNKAIEAKDATILAVTFWIGLSLILVYHVLWVIFMGVLLALWPFKTISPSGK